MTYARHILLTAIAVYATGCCCCIPPVSEEELARMRAEREARDAQRDAEAAEHAAEAAAAEQAKWDALPETERAFCEALTTHAAAYNEETNDLKRSKVRRLRADALRAAVPGGRVSKWSGTVNTLTTTGDGDVVLTVRLPCEDFTLGTWNNSLSDIGDSTLISANSPAYDTLAEMEVGQGINFSGRFIPEDQDGWKGTSMTEYGSMTGEAFLFHF